MNNGARILIIEDDPDTRANLCDILEMFGFESFAVGRSVDGLNHPQLGSMDVILLDRRLPDIQADELLPQLRQVAPKADIIVATGFADLDGTIAALRHGAADYLLKPIRPDALKVSIERCLERKRLQGQLLQAERLAAIGRAMTGLAHESRNALQRSQASLDLLAADLGSNPQAMKLIQRIQTAQDDLHRLYEDVREYARPIRLHPSAHRIDELLKRTWDELVVKRIGRDVRLVENVETEELTCPVEPFLIRQVFRNIIDNSLSACADPVTITVTWSDTVLSSQPALRISIHDNGPGVSPEALPRVFEEFFTTKTHGTGLGLAIVKRLVESHGGLLRAESNGGFEVAMTLPRTPAEPPV